MGWDDDASEDAEPHLRRSRSKSRRRRRSAEAPAAAEEAEAAEPERARHAQPPADEEETAPVARSASRRHRGEALQELAAEEIAHTRAPSPHATHTRLLVADSDAVPQLAALERAARPDVLFVRVAAKQKGADIVAAVAAAHRAAGSPLLRSAALWLAGMPEELENEKMHDEDEPTEAEARAQEVRKALRLCRRVVKGVAPLLAPAGRLHVITPGLLPPGPTHLAEDEAETAAELQAAADGRTLAVGRGVPLGLDSYVLLSPDGEAVNIDAVYFNIRALNMHVSVKLTGIDPHRRKVAGIEDAGDVQQAAMTWLKELPMLYSIMVGSFLSIFVPEHCTSYVAVCSEKNNTGAGSPLGVGVLVFNCLTAAAFVVSGGLFNRRETWLIEWLDADDEFPPTHLGHIIDAYPRIRNALRRHNLRCLSATRVTAIAVLVNFVLSSCLLLRNVTHAEKECCPGILPGATKTVSALLTNTLLVLAKLLHRLVTTGRSIRETAGVSSVHQLPLVYNVIDADHVHDDKDGDGDGGGDSDDEGKEMTRSKGVPAGALGGMACCACAASRDGEDL